MLEIGPFRTEFGSVGRPAAGGLIGLMLQPE
jgi:hypothetical protein